MKNISQLAISLFVVAAAAMSAPAFAQTGPVAENSGAHPELALTYTYIRGNAPPAGCGCFSLNGGSGSLVWPLGMGRFALVGSVTDTTAQNLLDSGQALNLSLYAAGVRYKPFHRGPWQPFGEALLGVAHASGALVKGQYSVITNANAALATQVGGGVDLRLSSHFALRLAEVNYLLTTFNNATNDRQNNLGLSAGLVFRFGQ
jgi:peptidoglycan-associated lipoprotein